MSERIRFHLDEDLNPLISLALRRSGIDITTTQESNLRTKPDEAQIEFVRVEGRVFITGDTDFLVFSQSTEDHPGIAFVPSARTYREIIRSVTRMHGLLTPEEMCGRVVYL